jgi:hypothetical protein
VRRWLPRPREHDLGGHLAERPQHGLPLFVAHHAEQYPHAASGGTRSDVRHQRLDPRRIVGAIQ